MTALVALSGCGSSGLFDRNRPDEFAVTRAKPLTVPAEFSLPAPVSSDQVQPADTKDQVLDALFGTGKPGQ